MHFPFYAGSFEGALEELAGRMDACTGTGSAYVVVTPNIDHFVQLDENAELARLYRTANVFYLDSRPLRLLLRLLRKRRFPLITGSDLFPALCRLSAETGRRVYILGGPPGEEARTLEKLGEAFPGLEAEIWSPPYGFDPDGPEGAEAVARVNAAAPHALFVCLGMPRQEIWSLRHGRHTQAGVVLSVGAALDFVIGRARRSPLWLRRMGCEWLWRLATNPGRLWRRYLLRDPKILRLALRDWRRG
jgi:N-acetylglucosaminyldiphosphoundecaprenol N-acetyl-beta-D-mannosaminyltransferase